MSYDLKSIHLPRLQGKTLAVFAAAMDNPALRSLLAGKLLRDGGILKLRELLVKEPPTVMPIAFTEASQQKQEFSDSIHASIPLPKSESFSLNTVQDFICAYQNGKLSPVMVAQNFLKALALSEQGKKPLRAFIAVDEADLMAQAEASTARLQKGQSAGPLEGVPIAIKDEVDQIPYPTTAGAKFLGQKPATQDSTVVAKLRAAGALLLGKTNMHEIGINPTGWNVHFGQARNPYNPDHDPGGSSGGSAVAVAAGLAPLALGADGGGSIRIPAALCGLVGLKATFGRISEHGAAPLCWSVGHLGPMGWRVADVALMYGVLAGPDPLDPNSMHQPPVQIPNLADPENLDLRRVRLGIDQAWFRHASPEIVDTCEKAVQKLVQAGATLQEIQTPHLDAMRIAHVTSIFSEMAASMDSFPKHHRDFGPGVRTSLALARMLTARDYIQAQRVRTQAMQTFRSLFQTVDVVVTPTTAVIAPLIPSNSREGWSDLSTSSELTRYAFVGNLTGLPAITVPVGYDRQGLPIGLQLMSRWWEESLLLRTAQVVENFSAWQKPQCFYSLLR